MNLLRVTGCSCGLNGFCCIKHHPVKFAQGFGRLFGCSFTLNRFALKRIVNRLSESVPHFLFLLALNRYALRLMLPALLQMLDRINMQHRCSTQGLSFFNHGLAAGQRVCARCFQRRVGGVHRGFPHRLNFCKNLFAQMPSVLPFFDKTVQAANVHFPICAASICGSPGQYFINQHLALGFDGFSLFFHRFQPGLNHFVRLVARIIKALPQRLVGRTALIGGFPQIPHVPEGVLLLSPAQRFEQKCFSLADQFFTNLVCAPALPAFQFTSSRQCGMGGCFKRAVDVANVLLQRATQFSRYFGGGFAVAACYFMLQPGNSFLDESGRLFAHVFEYSGVDFGFGWTGFLRRSRPAAGGAQLFGPHRYGWQRRSVIFRRFDRYSQRGLKCTPNGQQLPC